MTSVDSHPSSSKGLGRKSKLASRYIENSQNKQLISSKKVAKANVKKSSVTVTSLFGNTNSSFSNYESQASINQPPIQSYRERSVASPETIVTVSAAYNQLG